MTNVRQDGLWIDNTILDLFNEALAFGLVYGPEIPTHQWDEMRDTKAKQLTERAALATPVAAAEVSAQVRDDILHERGPLEGMGLTGDQINAVLAVLDDATPAAAAEVSDAEILSANRIADGDIIVEADEDIIRFGRRVLTLRTADRATPAPSPKVPTWLSIAEISDIARWAQIAFRLRKYGSFEVAFARLIESALATRGPIGAVEPVTDEQINTLIGEWAEGTGVNFLYFSEYRTEIARVERKDMQQFARAVLALSRTPGAGND